MGEGSERREGGRWESRPHLTNYIKWFLDFGKHILKWTYLTSFRGIYILLLHRIGRP